MTNLKDQIAEWREAAKEDDGSGGYITDALTEACDALEASQERIAVLESFIQGLVGDIEVPVSVSLIAKDLLKGDAK